MATAQNPSALDHARDEVHQEHDPVETVLQAADAYCLARCLHVVAKLGVADHLDDRPRTVAELAASVDANPDALGRALCLLAAHGLFERHGDTILHSPASRLLRTDHPQSLRDFVRMTGSPIFWTIYGEFEQSIRTGLPAAAKVLPAGLFSYFAEHPDEAAVFDSAMIAKSRGHVAGVLAAYDFSCFARIADIGGGQGHLLRAALDAAPALKGVLFDLPHVIEAAASTATERLILQSGDFFRDALPTCDAYLLMEVIHDWGDAAAVAILQAVRRAAPPHAVLLLIEQMIPNDPGPSHTRMVDIHMLTLLGGRQRTRSEYAVLLDKAGFVFQREIETPVGVSILEARVA